MVHKHEFSIHKKGEKTMDYTTNQKQFDNEMKALSIGAYKGQEKYIPKDWIMISESDNKSGFHGKAFFKNGTIVIAMRGTDDENDLANDIDMVKKKLPNQYADAQKFYEKIKKDFPGQKIVFTGHSLGGSLAQLMANKTGYETVTFNAYGVRDILQGNVRDNLENIRNYGNINDSVFNYNINNQLGNVYVIKKNYNDGNLTSGTEGYIGGLDPYFHHKAEWMGDLENSVKYQPNYLEGQVNMNIDFKDIDSNRIFTTEEIKQMTTDEYNRLENFINQQVAAGKVMPEVEAKQQLKAGNLIYVNSYIRSDGTEVKGYYRSRPNI